MSGHETIRVLEVGVDAQLQAEEESKGLESVAADGSQSGGPAEARGPAGEAGSCDPDHSAEATGIRLFFKLLLGPGGIGVLSFCPRGLWPLVSRDTLPSHCIWDCVSLRSHPGTSSA